MTQTHLFMMDPMDTVLVDKDSTFALMLEAQRRGHRVLYGKVDALHFREGRVYTVAQHAEVRKVQGDHATLGAPETVDVGAADVVWMRKDPPFNMDYIFNTYLLELAETQGGALIVNKPSGLRDMNEKAWAMRFPGIIPESLITQDMDRLRGFIDKLGHTVVKPLDGNGGAGVFVVRSDNPNIGVILEQSTQQGTVKVLCQRYLPEIKAGDKRIILVDGVAVGAIMRVPQGVDHRGNIHVGAVVEKSELTPRDQEICDVIGPYLEEQRQIFVGIDVIGNYLTEVNVTSPTGIHEVDEYFGISVAGLCMDAANRHLTRRARTGSVPKPE